MSVRPGRVRGARLTDLAALGDLSRLSHPSDERGDSETVRSLGLPVARSQVSVFSLFRLPLGAFRPSDQLYVYEEGSRVSGLARVERDTQRDEWTIVELDAIGLLEAGDIRLRLVQHLIRDGGRRGAVRFHVACADAGGNVELFMQAGFISYGQERILYRPPDALLPKLDLDEAAARCIRPATALDAVPLSRLYGTVTPPPVARLESYRLADWERQGGAWRIPRSSLSPILRFAEVEAWVQESRERPENLTGFVQVGVAKEDQPHYIRILVLPDADATPLIEHGLAVIAERTGAHRGRNGHRHERGVISPVRTYESPVDARLEDAEFTTIATVTLLMKEALVRVAEPVLVPAIR